MTLQEAKDQIARKYSVDNFNLTVWMTDEAAELYAYELRRQLEIRNDESLKDQQTISDLKALIEFREKC